MRNGDKPLRLPLLLILVAVAIACLQFRANGQSRSTPKRNMQAAQTGTAAKDGQSELAACPPAAKPPNVPARATGHHKVFLSWNTGAHSPSTASGVDGYCVYRSKKPKAAQAKATCNECEQVSPVAISSARCVDDVVEDGVTYYYVVTALKDKLMSSSSNEIAAVIPADPRPLASRPESDSPACRGR